MLHKENTNTLFTILKYNFSVEELIYFVSESKRFAVANGEKVKRRNSKSKRNHSGACVGG